MAAVDDLRPLVDASSAVLRVTSHLAGSGARRLLGGTLRTAPAALAGREVRATVGAGEEGAAARALGVLLDVSLVQSSREAEEALLATLVGVLVPDEARIIAALAARTWTPLVHIEPRRDGEDHLGLRNASLIGRQAGVALVRHTPAYVGRLLATGLLEVTPEREDRAEEYEVLLAEPDVLDAIRAAGRGPLGPRVRRGGLVLSGLGRRLWAARSAVGPGTP